MRELIVVGFAGGGGSCEGIRMVGNSVCPQVAEALVRANYIELEVSERGVPEFALAAAE